MFQKALLKYDAAAKADPKFIAQAYAETQPESNFSSCPFLFLFFDSFLGVFNEKGLEEYVELEKIRKEQAKRKPNTF